MYLRYISRDSQKVLQQWRVVSYMNADQYYSIIVDGWVDVPILEESNADELPDQIYLPGAEFDLKFSDNAEYQSYLSGLPS
jgi:hypothetical protein